jgi:NADP-dependent 3-hydroxy acid dehydrogenase YdfG
MGRLAGKVGVVTGASAGIGAATARALAADGMAVMIGARREDRLVSLCEEITAAGGRAAHLVTDMRDSAQVTALIDAAVARFGRLDALVNTAAIGIVRAIAEGRDEEWRAIFDTNVHGTLAACRAALKHMLPQGHGDIVTMTSASAHEAWPYLSVYAASKAALYTLSRGLRAEVSAQGVRVMTIEIHNVRGTDFAKSFDPEQLIPAMQRWVELGLLNAAAPDITPEAVAQAVAFQLSTEPPASVHELTIRSREN